MREFRLPGPGSYTMTFRARAQYEEDGETVNAEHDGDLEVVVAEDGTWD